MDEVVKKPNEIVKERIAVSVQKIGAVEYEIEGSIDVETVLDNISQFEYSNPTHKFSEEQINDKKLLSIRDGLIQNMKCNKLATPDTTPLGENYSIPDREWLCQAIDKFLNDVKEKVLLGGRVETIVKENFSGEKIKERKLMHHKYEISAKCSSILSNIKIVLWNRDSGQIEDSLWIRCVECVLGRTETGYLLRQYNPDESVTSEYRTNLTYIITATGNVTVKRPVIITSRFIIIPEDQTDLILEYDNDELKMAVKQLASDFSEIRVLPKKLDELRFKILKDKNGREHPCLVLDGVKAKLGSIDSLKVGLARYIFNEAEYYYGDVIFFADIHKAVEGLDWSELVKSEQQKFTNQLETAVRSLNDSLAKYFGLGDTLVISMDKESLGIRMKRQFFKKAKRSCIE